MNIHIPPQKPESPFGRAVAALRAAGHAVEPAGGVPGLSIVDGGPELTMGQIVDLALQKGLVERP